MRHTITLLGLPWTTVFVHIHQRNTLLLDERICLELIFKCRKSEKIHYIPASLLMPSLPATTQELAHSPHTNLSFPSLVHPDFEAATASTAGGLFA